MALQSGKITESKNSTCNEQGRTVAFFDTLCDKYQLAIIVPPFESLIAVKTVLLEFIHHRLIRSIRLAIVSPLRIS